MTIEFIKEEGFAPATLGGLAVTLKSEKGLFFVFSITEDLNDICFNHSPSGLEEDYERGPDIEGANEEDGLYGDLKSYLIEILSRENLHVKALNKFKRYYRSNFGEEYKPKNTLPLISEKIEIISIKKDAFCAASLGGLALYIQTTKGYFRLMGVLDNIDDIFFNYSKNGEDYCYGYELEGYDNENSISLHTGLYKELLEHLRGIVVQEKLLEQAQELHLLARSIPKKIVEKMKEAGLASTDTSKKKQLHLEITSLLKLSDDFATTLCIPDKYKHLFK